MSILADARPEVAVHHPYWCDPATCTSSSSFADHRAVPLSTLGVAHESHVAVGLRRVDDLDFAEQGDVLVTLVLHDRLTANHARGEFTAAAARQLAASLLAYAEIAERLVLA